MTEQESAIYAFPVHGGQAAMIQRTPDAFIFQPRCSPDSKKIAFNSNEDENSGIKVITLSDGKIEDIRTGLSDIDRIVYFDWSPDGKRFVFIGSKYGKKEFWFVEDFLSELN